MLWKHFSPWGKLNSLIGMLAGTGSLLKILTLIRMERAFVCLTELTLFVVAYFRNLQNSQ